MRMNEELLWAIEWRIESKQCRVTAVMSQELGGTGHHGWRPMGGEKMVARPTNLITYWKRIQKCVEYVATGSRPQGVGWNAPLP